MQTTFEHVRSMCAHESHRFWFDDLSLLDAGSFDPRSILKSDVITDVYLLAPAVKHGGRLFTFDASVATNAVVGFKRRYLERLIG